MTLAKQHVAMNDVNKALLVALVRACKDPRRKYIQEEGMEERDLAYESGMIRMPFDLDMPFYATVKRGRIVQHLNEMNELGLIEFQEPHQGGFLRVLPTKNGEIEAKQIMRPWFLKLLDRLLGTNK